MAAKEGAVTPESIKSRFLSFLSSFTGKRDRSPVNLIKTSTGTETKTSGENEPDSDTIKVERKIIDPRDRDAYYNRVKTYTTMTWFAKPSDLSPLECSRYGWQNTDTDMLECVSCKAKLCGQLPEIQNLDIYTEFYTKLKENIKASHEKCCSWSSYPSPVSFTKVELHDRREAMNDFSNRLRGLQDKQTDLPKLSCITFYDRGVNEDRLNNLINEFQHNLNTQENVAVRQEVIKCSLLLAACGWQVSKIPEVITCYYCRRNVGLWNYKGLDAHSSGCMDNTSGNIGEDKDGALPSKRLKVEEKDSFNPIEEHSYWCPWITDEMKKCNRNSSFSESPDKHNSSMSESPNKQNSSMSESCNKFSANQSFDGSPPTSVGTDTAWLQMLKMVFPSLVESDTKEESISHYFSQKSPVQGMRKIRRLLNDWSSPYRSVKEDKS